MISDSIKTTAYIIVSTALHTAAVIAITLSPSLLQIKSQLLGSAETDQSMDVVEISVAQEPQITAVKPTAPIIESPEAKSSDAVLVKAPEKKKAEPVIAAKPEKKEIKNLVKKAASKKTEASLPEKMPEEIQESEMVVETLSKSDMMKDLATDEVAETELMEAVAAADAAATEPSEVVEKQEQTEALAAPVTKSTEASDKLVAATEAETAAMPEKSETLSGSNDKEVVGNSAADLEGDVKQNFLQLRQAAGNKPPKYPERARLDRAEGAGQLKYFVTKDGQVTNLALTQSTGHKELDQAAIDSFKDFRFVPGQEGYTVHNFKFALKGSELPSRGRLRTTQNNQ